MLNYKTDHSNFNTHKSFSLNPSSLIQLFHNEIRSISIENFATRDECLKLAEAAEIEGYENYLNVNPPIGRIGITQFEAASITKQGYFDLANQMYVKQNNIFSRSFNPLTRLKNVLLEKTQFEVELAHENTQSYYVGLFRKINQSALLHADYAPFDAKGWAIENIIGQIAWNLCVNEPKSGGECLVYNKLWDQSDDQYRIKNSYGYLKKMVANCVPHVIPSSLGNAYFFNSRNFHEVHKSIGMRVTISCFLGLTKAGKILMWS